MSSATQRRTTTPATTTQVQSLLVRLDGITAGDYLTWVRDPEPTAFDHGLRSVAISAEPLGHLVNIELVWADQASTTPSAAAVAAGFPLTPEVVAVLSSTSVADRHRSPVEARTDPASFAEPFSHRAAVRRGSRTRCLANPRASKGTT